MLSLFFFKFTYFTIKTVVNIAKFNNKLFLVLKKNIVFKSLFFLLRLFFLRKHSILGSHCVINYIFYKFVIPCINNGK